MPISSNTLFHFTKKIEWLESILIKGFQPRYCLETFYFKRSLIDVGIPMVCFCDIPLSSIGSHLNIYGGYGIGMKKTWAIKKRLNPILYIENNSQLNESIGMILGQLNDYKAESNFSNYFFISEKVDLIRYIKPYEGPFDRTDLINYCFYNEREWRYVPTMSVLGLRDYYLTKMEFEDLPFRENRNNHLGMRTRLEFCFDDIKYLFIKSELERSSFVEFLETNSMTTLISKIMITDYIKSDF